MRCKKIFDIIKNISNTYFRSNRKIEPKARINEKITAKELRVISDAGENFGVLSLEKALALAQEKGLDLIEISPKAQPPVARIIKFDKWRYQEEKKLKKQKSGVKDEIKQIQISVRSASNDLTVKAKQVNAFLSKALSVRIVIVLRGREKANKNLAQEKLKEFLTHLNPHKVVMEPKVGGRGMITMIQPSK